MSRCEPERRKYRRFDLEVPMDLLDDQGQAVARVRTSNISDGGLFVVLPVGVAPAAGSTCKLRLTLSGTDAGEGEIVCQAKVLRHQPMETKEQVGLAMQFVQPICLGLDK